jgi:hypothetical protein
LIGCGGSSAPANSVGATAEKYDPGDAHPDVFWKTKAHHEQFGYLLQEFQQSQTKYDFQISDGGSYHKASEY